MRKISHVVLHTAAARGDQSAAIIDQWHKNQGWSKIGYHWVVRKGGWIERGRPESEVGAGVAGFNAHSIHVCVTGHGDLEPWTPRQIESAVRLVAEIVVRHGLKEAVKANPNRVLGHREVWYHKLVPKPIRKTCPGKLVDMKAFRLAVVRELL